MRTEKIFACPLRVRHHAEDVAVEIAEAGNVIAGAVGICSLSDLAVLIAITKNDLIVFHQLMVCRVIASVIALSVSNR